jgi:hypothetical protein
MFGENSKMEEAYNNYFGEKTTQISEVVSKPVESIGIIKNEKLSADGNISTMNGLGNTLRKLLNTIWGTNWGDLEPDTSDGLDPDNITLPKITYSTNLREISEGKSPKPTLTDVTREDIDGEPTGEFFKTYRQSFDCIIEFNVRAKTSLDCSELAEQFEDAIILHSGYLKKKGISEIFFLKEVPAKYSNFYSEKIPTKCLYFFVRLEKVRIVSVNSLKEIETQLGLIGENSDK